MSERERKHAALIRDQFTKQADPFAALAIHSSASSLTFLRDGLRLRGDERVLDAGCGPGLLAHYLAQFAANVVGLDATPAMLAKARALAAEQGITNCAFVEGDMERLPFADGSFDAVVTRYTFHHLLHPDVAMAELARVCRPNGRVVVCDATPRLDARDAYDAWERERDPSHASARTESELLALVRASLVDCELRRFRLESPVLSLLASSFPTDAGDLHARLAADVGVDALDMSARMDGETLFMAFPVSVISGSKAS